MLFENFKNEQFKIFLQNQKLTIALVASMVLNLVQGVYMTNQKVVFLPPFNQSQEFWVTSNRVSSSYLEQIGRYISEVLWNVSPDNAKLVKSQIMPLVPSSHWNDVDRALTRQLGYITDNAITRVFLPANVNFNERNVLYVRGTLKEMAGDVVALSKTTTLRIQYKIENGRFWLISVNEVDIKQ